MNKTCSCCLVEKDTTEFSKRKDRYGKVVTIGRCKLCVTAYRKQYYADNKEVFVPVKKVEAAHNDKYKNMLLLMARNNIKAGGL